jgi:ATP-dependent helicase/nuclease subunit A
MTTQIVAASAGTGKTYRLAQQLVAELLSPTDPIAPERVVAMTYTRAAAAELEARVRRALLEENQPQLARRLGAARIGTIHAVCARIVHEHAFELGLSPELVTIEENRSVHAVREALELEVAEDERALLDELDLAMGSLDWQGAVKEIIDAARLNGLDALALKECAERSAGDLAAALPAPRDAADIEGDLRRVIDAVLQGPMPRMDAAREAWHELHEMRRALERKERIPWPRWLGLRKAHMHVLRRFASEHVHHPRLVEDLVTVVRLVFGIAARALQRYDEEKRRWGVFDFVDQETLVLELLRNPAVRQRLQEEIGLVLVDEFQDTSPLQLAILSELSGLSARAFFVGDQKQAIFGFRGTDPALMERVMEALPTTSAAPLSTSYRSRPGFVELTSALFVPAFARQGIPAERVRVRASLEEDDPRLGPFVERWRTSGDLRAAAGEIAAGVRALLDDESVCVRDGEDIVRARPEHIAVLVRTNDHAAEVAEALAAAGIAAVRRRRGLGATLEARALMAGLSLFLDGGDRLAAAEIARLTTRTTAEPDEWLQRLVAQPRGQAFGADPVVAAVVAAGQQHRDAGVVAAVDLVVEAMRLRDACAAWGDTEQRLANLGALRALATRFVRERTSMGGGATVAGLLARLEDLAQASPFAARRDDPDDEQGDVAGQDAVEVVTWHKAKGREWPIVVLGQLQYARPPSAFGVHVESDATSVDVKDPLRGRWVRYWPNPYGFRPDAGGGIFEALAGHPVQARLEAQSAREELRLLYVGWTRARDRLVLPGPVPDGGREAWDLWRGQRSILRHLADRPLEEGGAPLLGEPEGAVEPGDRRLSRARWAGHDVAVLIRAPAPIVAREPPARERETYAPLPPQLWAPASLQPSALAEVGEADEPVSLGSPIVLRTFGDEETMAHLGSAVHGFLAAVPWRAPAGADDHGRRVKLAADLLERFAVQHLIGADDLVLIGERLRGELEVRFPGAGVHREAPVTQRLVGGTVVRGIIDLAIETAAGYVIVDHKTYMTMEPRALSAGFAGQLRAYARALAAATAKPVISTLIHLPLSGALVAVR